MKDTDHRNSKMHKIVISWVRKYFSGFSVTENFKIMQIGRVLFIDIRMKSSALTIFIEVDGPQHDKFNKHFHGTLTEFQDSQVRDSMKEDHAEERDIIFIRIKENFKMTGEEFKELIFEAMAGGND